MSLYDDIEAAARRKLHLGEHYEMCSVELIPHLLGGWEIARVSMAIRLTGHGATAWAKTRRTTIRRDEIESRWRNDD